MNPESDTSPAADSVGTDSPDRILTESDGQELKIRSIAPSAWAALFIIVLLAAGLRFPDLDRIPAGLFRDEAEKGYNAWAILTDGGAVEFSSAGARQAVIGWNAWPYVINVMGVKTSAVYQYASVPFVAAGGLSVAATRMAAAFAGTLAVALLGLLLLRIWEPSAALGAALWLALCPWHWVFSRWALQGIFVPLGMIGVLAGASGAERRRPWGLPLAGLSLGFLFYAYSGAQPFTLVWAAGLALLYRRAIVRQPLSFALAVLLLALGAGPRIWIMLSGEGAARLDAVAVWTQEGATPGSAAVQFLRNYLAHFNPVFLFLRGDALPRHAVWGFGQLLLIDVLLLPLGLVASFRRGLPLRGALLLAFLLGPIGAAITRIGIPHALRALPMVVPAAVWGGVGLAVAAEWIVAGVERAGAAGTGNPGSARRRGRILAAGGVLVACLLGLRVHGIYRNQHREDPGVRAAFSAAERGAFEQVRTERRAGQNVWVSGSILYAPYFAMFFNQLPPRDTALKGLESQGFTVFAPGADEQVRGMMRPGDWMIGFDPSNGAATVWQRPD